MRDFIRRHRLNDMWFLFFMGYFAILGGAVLFISLNPWVIQ